MSLLGPRDCNGVVYAKKIYNIPQQWLCRWKLKEDVPSKQDMIFEIRPAIENGPLIVDSLERTLGLCKNQNGWWNPPFGWSTGNSPIFRCFMPGFLSHRVMGGTPFFSSISIAGDVIYCRFHKLNHLLHGVASGIQESLCELEAMAQSK